MLFKAGFPFIALHSFAKTHEDWSDEFSESAVQKPFITLRKEAQTYIYTRITVYVNYKGNELADQAAKEAAQDAVRLPTGPVRNYNTTHRNVATGRSSVSRQMASVFFER